MGFKDWLHKITSPDVEVSPPVTEPTSPKKTKAKKTDHGLPDVTETPPMPETVKKPRTRKAKPKKVEPKADDLSWIQSEKELATAKGEPWVKVISMDIDVDNPSSGSFSLDWNLPFYAMLLRAGYVGNSEHDVVDQWFTNVCRNVLEQNYEQELADPEKRARMGLDK